MRPVALHARNPGPLTGAGNWTWLIHGRVPTLIDAGVGSPQHLDELEETLDGAVLGQVLVTHAHSDHAAGATAIAGRMPSAKFLKMPWPDRDDRFPVGWVPLADGDVVDAGDTSLAVVHTPGHAPDHACFWHAATRALFGGDLAIQGTTVWIPVSLGGDLDAYIASLDRVLALDPSRVFPAHGPIITDPGPLLRGYLEHRHQRERQVIDALRSGDVNPSSVVTRLYPALAEHVVPRAVETILAHLHKLERDGVVRRAGNAWHIIDP